MSATAAVKARKFVRELLESSSVEPGKFFPPTASPLTASVMHAANLATYSDHRASLVSELRRALLHFKQVRSSTAKAEVYMLLDLTELSYGGQLALLEAIAEF